MRKYYQFCTMKQALTLILIGLFFTSCDDDVVETQLDENEYVKLNLSLKKDDEVKLQNTYDFNEFKLKASDFKLYLSDVYLHIGQDSVLYSDIILFDFENNPSLSNPINNIEPNAYDKISFGFGVKPSFNDDSDQLQVEANHPLGFTGSNGMHWGWETGYKYLVFDAMLDTGATRFNYPISYHVGLSELYQYYTFDLIANFDISEVTLTSNLNSWFALGAIDVFSEKQTHSTSNKDLAIKFKDVFINSLSIEIE